MMHEAKVHPALADMDSFGLERAVRRQVQLHELLLVGRHAHFDELLKDIPAEIHDRHQRGLIVLGSGSHIYLVVIYAQALDRAGVGLARGHALALPREAGDGRDGFQIVGRHAFTLVM